MSMKLLSLATGRPVLLVTLIGAALGVLGQPPAGSDVFSPLGSQLTTVGAVLGILVWVPVSLLIELTDTGGLAFVGGSGIGVALAMTIDWLWRRWLWPRRES